MKTAGERFGEWIVGLFIGVPILLTIFIIVLSICVILSAMFLLPIFLIIKAILFLVA